MAELTGYSLFVRDCEVYANEAKLRRTQYGFSSLKLIRMAELTGFEPAISCVTGRHVRPLHHSSALLKVVPARGLEPPTY